MVAETYKVTLVNLYPAETMARYLLSSYVLKAYLNKVFTGYNGVSVSILNYSNKTAVSGICEQIIKDNPDCVGYSCYIWNIERILKVIKSLKDKLKAKHILGGPEISLNMIQSLPDPSLGDYYVIGEGEKRFSQLISYLKNKSLDVEFPKGVASWGDSKLNYSADTNNITDLDEIPSIYLTGVLEERLYARQQALMETQRGCRYKCKYCVYHKNLSSICYYSEQRVRDELDHLIIKKPVMALRILDAVFTSNLQRAKKIAQHLLELKDRGIRLPWIYWEFTYRDVDEEFIKLVASLKYRNRILNTDEVPPLDRPQLYSDLLKNYTLVSSVGVESFYKPALKAVGRPGINMEKFDAFMNLAREYNIVLKADIILGLPFETFASYFEGLEFFVPYFKDTDHILNIHLLSILPGSDLDNLCERYGIKYSREAPHLVFSTNGFSEEELARASKLSAVLFRVLNSPLRKLLFAAKEGTGQSFLPLLEKTFDKISASPEFKETRLVRSDYVDDGYWNGEIYEEIPSQWLINFFERELHP